jgi:hypothetical protein
MGLRMNELHMPSVANAQNAGGPAGGTASLEDLMAEKDRMEKELSALSGVLDSVQGHLEGSGSTSS